MCTLLAAADAPSHEHIIKYRQALMQAAGAYMTAISLIAESQLMPLERLNEHARQLQHLSMLFESAFQKKVVSGRTDARPEIWVEWDEFVELAKEMGEASNRLTLLGAEGDLWAITGQVKALARVCGKCHQEFRKPRAQSYKYDGGTDLNEN
ncbi:MAG: c-type cytochrome [Gammaproteobacteria bacterium]